MRLSDSHCHLDLYKPNELREILAQSNTVGVRTIISMGMDLESSARTTRLAQSHEQVFAGVGIHPWNAVPPSDYIRQELKKLSLGKKVVVIGEVGLDYARGSNTKEIQKDLLRYEVAMARERKLPVSVHSREAHGDMMSILRPEVKLGLRGIIHGFSGDKAILADWLDLGFYISIGFRGLVTNENPIIISAIRSMPLDRLITETDCADTGQPPGPGDVSTVVQKLADIRGEEAEMIAEKAMANMETLLITKGSHL
jgi:TatD DNase family protein